MLNGDCFFNIVFVVFFGYEDYIILLCFLVVGELYFNIKFYVDYEVFSEILRCNFEFVEDVLFLIVLILRGE